MASFNDMTSICAWCGKILRQGSPEAEITHGMCTDCVEYFKNDDVESLQQFIDKLEAPVLLVDDTGKVITVNKAALNAIGKVLDQVRGYNGGDVMECAYARLPGGCGKTEHCAACTIRNTVMDTHRDGLSRKRTTAFQEIVTPEGVAKMRFLISTEKEGDIVLLRIDEMTPVA